MGKKKKTPKAAPGADKAPFHSAFAGLAGLRDQLPEGEAPSPEPVPEAPEAEPGEPTLKGDLVVRHERKGRGGKTVTLLLGLRGDTVARQALARQLGKGLGCGARVEGEQVVLSGDLRERLHVWLEQRGAKVRLG